MIVAQLIGGLGNQLFQYAAARQLAEIHRTELFLDLSDFETYKLHRYSLQHFNITGQVLRGNSVRDALPVVKEKKHFHFDQEFKAIADDVRLKGYWQTEKYFVEIAGIIGLEFEVKEPLAGRNLEIANMIRASNSVSMHIRRGDYVPKSYDDQILDSLGLTYYENALIQLGEAEAGLQCFVFSDDPEWVKHNLRVQFPVVYVDHNSADTNYEDLRLMSLCCHNIIANSSFSWWGAWLNRNEKKRIFAPRQWLNANARDIEARDIIPESWTRI